LIGEGRGAVLDSWLQRGSIGVRALLLTLASWASVAAKEPTALELAALDARVMADVAQGLAQAGVPPGARALATCRRTADTPWPGLMLNAGIVTGADVLAEIGGFAKSANTTGGLGGALKVVTTTADYLPFGKEPAIAGSLRAALEDLAKSKSPGWVVFSSDLGPKITITLKAPLRPTDTITIDGRCADVTLETTEKLGLIYIFGTRNIIVSNLAFRKSDYVAGRPDDDVEGCIRLNGAFDAVAILHNDLERCSDGVIDSTISPKNPIPNAARVTVAFNFIRDHDKTMLFGTFGCVDGSETFAQGCQAPGIGSATPLPALYLTLEGNIFYRTGQRHPRVYGRVYAHLANNIIVFEQQKKGSRKDGAEQFGSGYGTFVSNGAQALIERNVYLALGRNARPSAVWTTTSPGAEAMPEDVAGAIRLAGNLANERALMADNAPETVADPIYRGGWTSPVVAGRSVAEAIACIAGRAGRGGIDHWSVKLCGAPE
jgi:pectate lyase